MTIPVPVGWAGPTPCPRLIPSFRSRLRNVLGSAQGARPLPTSFDAPEGRVQHALNVVALDLFERRPDRCGRRLGRGTEI